MRITKISVKGLFGMFDHEIPLNQESRITIVHGPNGVGKTILLQMAHSVFNYGYQFIGKIPFALLIIEFESNRAVVVNKIDNYKRLSIEFKHIDYYLQNHPELFMGGPYYGPSATAFLPITENYGELESYAKDVIPDYWSHLRVDEKSYWYDPSDELDVPLLSEQDILDKYPQLHTSVYGQMPD